MDSPRVGTPDGRWKEGGEPMIGIEVNGKSKEISGGQTVADLLRDLGLNDRLVVVEVNRQIVRRNEIEDVPLQAGDQVEIVHFVGGG
jgi:thiamine biosynthesis protein ThiS